MRTESPRRWLLFGIVVAALVLAIYVGTSGDRHGRVCVEWMSSRVGPSWLTAFWDYEFMRADGLMTGADSEIGTSNFPGVPVDGTQCVVQVGQDLVAFLESPDVALDPVASADYERDGSEVGTRLDFISNPLRPGPYDASGKAFELLIQEGSFAGHILTQLSNDPQDPVGAVGIARGDTSPFDLVGVRVGDNADRISNEAAIELFDEWVPLGAEVVRRGDNFIVMRIPITGDPKSWVNSLLAALDLGQYVNE